MSLFKDLEGAGGNTSSGITASVSPVHRVNQKNNKAEKQKYDIEINILPEQI